ncbi:hypothetical protein TARUN_3393 [Trichoderma arundinaceum]|uniref:Uncharacterized protein n=1 Tax=Trichoderma arundinaceum TaxID=490622 RepID=A0A395NRX0_TRIAR|nr:hypothetical protein TARUN_3393 [Trichoderma arundinaceum]
MKMSGSGGFYKYRCKNFYSHNCPNWVWVNNSPCATCIAEGKDAEERSLSASLASREIVAPRVRDGILQYTIMELVAPSESGESWTLRDKHNGIAEGDQPPQAVPVTSSALPSSHRIMARWQ